jgi:hypothetical protein
MKLMRKMSGVNTQDRAGTDLLHKEKWTQKEVNKVWEEWSKGRALFLLPAPLLGKEWNKVHITEATYRPTIPAPDGDGKWWVWSSQWNDWQEKPKYSEKTCPSAALSTTNPTWPDLGSNPGRHESLGHCHNLMKLNESKWRDDDDDDDCGDGNGFHASLFCVSVTCRILYCNILLQYVDVT